MRKAKEHISTFGLIFRLTVGMLVLFITYPIALITKYKYSNCWIYAMHRYLEEGGYVVFRRTKWNLNNKFVWEHALWTKDLKEFYTFVPNEDLKHRYVPPLLFQGNIISFFGIEDNILGR